MVRNRFMADKTGKKGGEQSAAEKGEKKSAASKFKGYVARPEVKELYATFKVSAKVIDGASKTFEILSKPWVKDRFPSIAAIVIKVANFSEVLGPAGLAVGVAVDVLSALGLVEDAVMAKLNQISRQIEDLRDDVNKGFDDIKRLLDRNLALGRFLNVYDKLHAQVEVYERNVVLVRVNTATFSERLAAMIHENTIDEIIYDLQHIHNMMSGKGK